MKRINAEEIERLLNYFGQTLEDLPKPRKQSDVIERLVSALNRSIEDWDDLRETIDCMGASVRPYEDRFDSGYDVACTEILKYMENYKRGKRK